MLLSANLTVCLQISSNEESALLLPTQFPLTYLESLGKYAHVIYRKWEYYLSLSLPLAPGV